MSAIAGPLALGSSDVELSCGGVPTIAPPPLVRRSLDGKVRNVLVTGGAGFIASHFALMLIDRGGFNVTIVDDLSRGSIDTVLRLKAIAKEKGQPIQFERLDVARQFDMEELLTRNEIEAVVHFSGNAYVGESMVRPEDYYQNITVSTVAILRAMQRAKVSKLIFSSSCATFGSPTTFPITETTPQRPTNPYGNAKLQAEQAIIHFQNGQKRAGKPFSAALLRYFNVIGADPAGRLGPHLRHQANKDFPRIVDAAYDVALGLRPKLSVMGSTFPTKDGSAQRDYIHVTDLVEAHVMLIAALRETDLMWYNVGNGMPYTVLEIVDVVEKISGKKVPVTLKQQRPGDPPILYADPAKIKFELGWRPRYADIETMVAHGWRWRVDNYGALPAPSVDPLMHNGPACTTRGCTPTGEHLSAASLGDNPKIVVIGAGPTGLCAAYRLTELGYTNWKLLEGSAAPAGLACSVTDDAKFTWDIGVHCLFSHFEFFDALLDDQLPPKDWLYHQRYSPALMRQKWVGYPVQSNLWRLPQDEVMGIIQDLATKEVLPKNPSPRNFDEWLVAGFGEGLTKAFMRPYNAKVWAHPAVEMNSIWVGERVATIRFDDILANVIQRKDAPAWGPNAQFRYPLNGTGMIWEKVYATLPAERKQLNAKVVKVHTKPGAKSVELADGTHEKFDGLLSTMPLPHLLRMTPDHPELAQLAAGDNGARDESKFKHQTVNLVGVGIWGIELPEQLHGVHWVYFPEDAYVFYRVTVLSNFSPLVVAHPYRQWSLLVEISESKHRTDLLSIKGADAKADWTAEGRKALRERVVHDLKLSGMLPQNASIASVWDMRLEYGYPVPYVERNMHVHAADEALRRHGIWSRGRFGSWKYEVGNQDHSCMLGYDAVDNMLFDGSEEGREATFNRPSYVNGRYRRYDRDFDPASLAKQAGRAHTFDAPPRRLKKLPQYDWVTYHCKQGDGWVDKIRQTMLSQAATTKWLVHGYEHCGYADVKRPMLEMLREGLNHHDRIPTPGAAFPAYGWVRHIVAHYHKLPELLFFAKPDVPTDSRVFLKEGKGSIPEALAESPDFSLWGTHVVELPAALHEQWCAKVWPLAASGASPKARKRGCPERVVTMSGPLMYVSKRRVVQTPLNTWRKVLELLDSSTQDAGNDVLMDFAWHVFFGQPPVLQGRFMQRH